MNITLSASGTSGSSADQPNANDKGVIVVVDVTALTGTTPSIIVKIQGKDSLSGKYYDLLTSASISTVSTVVLTIYPGGLTTTNLASSTVLPPLWRVAYTIAGTTPAITATIGATTLS